MKGVRADSAEAFLALLEGHRKILFKVAYAYGPGAGEREDLLQEILAALWRAFPRYDDRLPFGTWAYRIALNVAISAFRIEQRRTARLAHVDPFTVDTSVDQAPADERVEQLHAFIGGLDDLDKALMLLYLDAYSYADIALTLGLSQTNVATKISRLKTRAKIAFDRAGSAEGAFDGSR